MVSFTEFEKQYRNEFWKLRHAGVSEQEARERALDVASALEISHFNEEEASE